MRLQVFEDERHYRLVFRFRSDKVSDECYSICLPRAESPAELATILRHECLKLQDAVMRKIKQRCGRTGGETEALTYPADRTPGGEHAADD